MVLKMSPICGPINTRIAMTTIATNAMMSAYSTNPCPCWGAFLVQAKSRGIMRDDLLRALPVVWNTAQEIGVLASYRAIIHRALPAFYHYSPFGGFKCLFYSGQEALEKLRGACSLQEEKTLERVCCPFQCRKLVALHAGSGFAGEARLLLTCRKGELHGTRNGRRIARKCPEIPER